MDFLPSGKGLSTTLKILLVAVTLLIMIVIILSIFDARVTSANEMLSQLASGAFGNLTQALSGLGS